MPRCGATSLPACLASAIKWAWPGRKYPKSIERTWRILKRPQERRSNWILAATYVDSFRQGDARSSRIRGAAAVVRRTGQPPDGPAVGGAQEAADPPAAGARNANALAVERRASAAFARRRAGHDRRSRAAGADVSESGESRTHRRDGHA